MSYALKLWCVWGLLPELSLGVIGCLVSSIVFFALERTALGAAFLGGAALALLMRLWWGTRGATARVLSGGLPFWLCGRNAPRTRSELKKTIKRLMPFPNESPAPSVVGSGWGWWSMRRAAPGPTLYTHRFCGRERHLTFLAGTTLYDATEIMLRELNVTLWSHPSSANISLGGAYAPPCHGSRGDAGHGSSHGLHETEGIELWNMRKLARNEPEESYAKKVGYKELRRIMDTESDKLDKLDYIVVAVRFDLMRLAPNKLLQTELIEITDSETASKFLNPGRVLSVLFVGSARPKVALGLRYTDQKPGPGATRPCCWPFWCRVPHVDPHDCSRACRALQLDTCSVLCGWYERETYRGQALYGWRGVISLRDANLWTPLYTPPIGPLMVMACGIYNFEIMCRPRILNAGNWLHFLLIKLHDMHAKHAGKGRTELRFSQLQSGVLFLDCSLRHRGFALPFKLLKELGIKKCALHSSKYKGPDLMHAIETCGMSLTTPYDIFFDTTSVV